MKTGSHGQLHNFHDFGNHYSVHESESDLLPVVQTNYVTCSFVDLRLQPIGKILHHPMVVDCPEIKGFFGNTEERAA